MCFGGSAPAAPAPPPPPQLAIAPTPAAVRGNTAAQTVGVGSSTLLTGGLGAPVDNAMLGKKSLLGQ